MENINRRSGLSAALLRGGLPLLALCLLATGATCDKSKGENPFTGPGAALGQIIVKDVSVPGPNQVKITADGSLDKAYPFSMTDPLRIGVDVKDATFGSGAPGPIPGSGIIDKVEVVPSDKPSHVKVVAYVRQNATYKMNRKGNEITLTVEPQANSSVVGAGASTIPYKETKSELERQLKGAPPSPYSDLSSGDASASSAGSYSSNPTTGPFLVNPMPAPNADGTANTVGDVFYRTIRGGIQIMIYTNGNVKNMTEHAEGSRIVVELNGVRSTAKRSYPLAYAGISRVRVDGSGGGTTVSIDFNRGLGSYEVHRTSSGIVVTVYQ
jgi:hypothetical protein